MIKIEGLNKQYKGANFEVNALVDISLRIEENEFVAVMGESGSGKSTLLNCIGLMDTFESGKYYLNDIAVHELKPNEIDRLRKNYISFVFQHYELMRNYTIYENLSIPLLAKNIKSKERKKIILNYANQLGIDKLLTQYPNQLSGGQQQRAAIARALISGNKIILADEPTGALDQNTSRDLMELFKKIHQMGYTIIVITHDQNVAEYAQRIIMLHDGKIKDMNSE